MVVYGFLFFSLLFMLVTTWRLSDYQGTAIAVNLISAIEAIFLPSSESALGRDQLAYRNYVLVQCIANNYNQLYALGERGKFTVVALINFIQLLVKFIWSQQNDFAWVPMFAQVMCLVAFAASSVRVHRKFAGPECLVQKAASVSVNLPIPYLDNTPMFKPVSFDRAPPLKSSMFQVESVKEELVTSVQLSVPVEVGVRFLESLVGKIA